MHTASVSSALKPGDSIAGKYRVERVLGSGGMGMVVAAIHLDLNQRMAIKLMLPEKATEPESAARFLREARAAVKLQSEHVARVLDVGRLSTGEPYMVMEYMDGSDLAHVIKTQGPLPIHDAVEYVLQACEAIAEAHQSGIVHRDLKPANLFLTKRRDGSALLKVLDFGISKAIGSGADAQQPSVITMGAVLGSPAYMSPEQIRSSQNVDCRTDIWGLGCILYELLVGRPVFQAESIPALCLKVANDPLPAMHAQRQEIPQGLERLVMRCLEKDPDFRPQSVSELATALVAFGPARCQASVDRVAELGGGATGPSPTDGLPQEGGDRPIRSEGSTGRTLHRRGPLFLGAVAVLLVAVATILGSLGAAQAPELRSVFADRAGPLSGVPLPTLPSSAMATDQPIAVEPVAASPNAIASRALVSTSAPRASSPSPARSESRKDGGADDTRGASWTTGVTSIDPYEQK